MEKENSSNKNTQNTTNNDTQENQVNELRQDKPTISDELAKQINHELIQKEKSVSDPINSESCQTVSWNNNNNNKD